MFVEYLCKGMHKKSLEAAEALKSSDENSDKEDEVRTEHSDTSSSNNHRKSPSTPTLPAIAPAMAKSKITSNSSPSSTSISPVTMSPPITNHSIAPTQRSSDDLGKKDYSLMSSPTSRAPSGGSFHLSSHEQNNSSPIVHHPHPPTAPPAHHYPMNHTPSDTDPEVFRWVNYNRDIPVSFIR